MSLDPAPIRSGDAARAIDVLRCAAGFIKTQGWRCEAIKQGYRINRTGGAFTMAEAVEKARYSLNAHWIYARKAEEALRGALGLPAYYAAALPYWERQRGRSQADVLDAFKDAITDCAFAEKGAFADVTV